jgi:hypothetical protein
VAEDPTLRAELDAAFAEATATMTADRALQSMIDQGILMVRNSRDVQVARIDVILEAAILAAEQVQDVRIARFETPPEVTFKEFAAEVLISIVLDTPLAGKLLAAATKLIFSSVLKKASVFAQYAEGPLADKIKADAKNAIGRLRGRSFTTSLDLPDEEVLRRWRRWKDPANRWQQTLRVLEAGSEFGSSASPRLSNVDPGQLQTYHRLLQALTTASSDVEKTLTGMAKATVKGAQKWPQLEALKASDSAGVTIISRVQQYAVRSRLAVHIMHNEFELALRRQMLIPNAEQYVEILQSCGYDAFVLKVDQENVSANLDELRDGYRYIFEAVIWSHLFSFVSPKPEINETEEQYKDVPKQFTDYWFERFGLAVDQWNVNRGWYAYKGKFKDLNRKEKLHIFRDYFWDIGRKKLAAEKLYQTNSDAIINVKSKWL